MATKTWRWQESLWSCDAKSHFEGLSCSKYIVWSCTYQHIHTHTHLPTHCPFSSSVFNMRSGGCQKAKPSWHRMHPSRPSMIQVWQLLWHVMSLGCVVMLIAVILPILPCICCVSSCRRSTAVTGTPFFCSSCTITPEVTAASIFLITCKCIDELMGLFCVLLGLVCKYI